MPHRSGNKWRWGNLKRKSKEDLRKTVYGIWAKNGSKGSFSKFWKTGKVDEGEGPEKALAVISFKKVPRRELPALLDEISSYAESPRWSRAQFEKYLYSEKTIDAEDMSMYYGAFADGKCLALSYLNKVPDGCVLIAQVSSVAKGFGKVLIENILARAPDVWWGVDPAGGEDLLSYYRSNFGDEAEEVSLRRSKWAATRFFVRASGAGRAAILDMIEKAGA